MAHKLLEDRRAKIILWAVLGIVLGFWANATWVDRIHSLERSMNAAFGQYKEALNQRASVLPEMIGLLKNYAPQESALIQELVQSYEYAVRYQPAQQMLTEPKLAAQYMQLQQAIVDGIVKSQKTAQNYPALSQNRQYFMLMNQWGLSNAVISSKQMALNRVIDRYNQHISGFPQEWYNKIFYRFPLKIPSQMPASI